MSVYVNPAIVTSGLKYLIDPFNSRSYPTGGTTSTVVDISNNGLNAQLLNGTFWTNTNSFASFRCDGINDYISSSGNADFLAWTPQGSIGSSSLTIEVWIKTTDGSGTAISKPWNALAGWNYILSGQNFSVGPVHQSYELTATQTVTPTYYDGNIHQLVLWMNSTEYGWSLDGGKESGSAAHGFTSDNPLSRANSGIPLTLMTQYPYPGFGGNAAISIIGNIYNTKVYSRQLTATEIAQNFNALRSRYGV